MSVNDQNAIKAIQGLAENNRSSFLTIDGSFITDPSNNPISPQSTPVMVRDFTDDSVPPSLAGFSLDLDNGELVLSFNETVNPETADISGVSLYLEASDSSDSVQLRGMTISTMYSTTVNLSITENTLNELKRLKICSTNNAQTLSLIHI